MINEKHFKGIKMSLHSLHKDIAAKKLENKAMINLGSKLSNILVSKFNKVVEI